MYIRKSRAESNCPYHSPQSLVQCHEPDYWFSLGRRKSPKSCCFCTEISVQRVNPGISNEQAGGQPMHASLLEMGASFRPKKRSSRIVNANRDCTLARWSKHCQQPHPHNHVCFPVLLRLCFGQLDPEQVTADYLVMQHLGGLWPAVALVLLQFRTLSLAAPPTVRINATDGLGLSPNLTPTAM